MLANEYPEVRRECFDFLKICSAISKKLAKRSDGETMLALWFELEPDLAELDDYGGGDYGLQDHVGELLDQIREKVSMKSRPLRNSRNCILKKYLNTISQDLAV